jgi:4'-phosphopantetheinyl transferase EntD
MIETLLPPGVVSVEALSPLLWEEGLLPEEERCLGVGAVAQRRRDFTAGRNCARRALALLGAPAGPVLVGENREPRWPPGVVGSITHTEGYCAAVVAWSSRVAGVGIDAELHVPLPESAVRTVCTDAEREWMATAPDAGRTHWAAVMFAAKESVYKAWFPLARRWLGFADAELAIDPERRVFGVRTRAPAPLGADGAPISFHGRFRVSGGRVLAATSAYG